MSCAGCWQTHALAGLYVAQGGTFLRCLLQKLAQQNIKEWTPEAHAALYAEASTVLNLRGDQSADAMRSEPFASNPQRAAQIAAYYPVSKLDGSDTFWSCIDVTRDEAAASMSAGSGDYWNAVIAAGRMIAVAEGAPARPRGSIVAALCTLILGTASLLTWVE